VLLSTDSLVVLIRIIIFQLHWIQVSSTFACTLFVVFVVNLSPLLNAGEFLGNPTLFATKKSHVEDHE